MQTSLTKRQREVLDYITEQVRANGYPPTLEEIGRALGMRSLATVHKHIEFLVAKGRVSKRWNHSRSILVNDACPTCGHRVQDEAKVDAISPI